MKRGDWKWQSSFGVLTLAAGIGLAQWGLPGQAPGGIHFLPPAIPDLSIQDLRDGMTIPHYAKIAGIAGQFHEDGVVLPANLDLQVRYAERLAETKYNQYEGQEEVEVAYDMARSEGALEVREGEWTIDALAGYVEQVMALDQRFVEVADAASAFLQDEGMTADDADFYIRQSIGLAYLDYQLPGKSTLEGDDARVQIREAGHEGVVMDLHGRMHAFFQHRLEELDIADEGFMIGADYRRVVETANGPAAEDDETPGMEM